MMVSMGGLPMAFGRIVASATYRFSGRRGSCSVSRDAFVLPRYGAFFVSGLLGQVYMVKSMVQGSRGSMYGWRGHKENGGGMLLDWGIHLIDQAIMHSYCVAADFLSYANPSVTAEEAALRSFLSNLVSVADKCAPKHGEAIENENKGKKLGEFSFLNASERFEADWLKKQPSALASFMEDVSGSEAEKIVRFYKRAENIGRTGPADALQYVMDELNEVGVELNERQLKTLISLINNYHNNSRLWCTAGWKPSELAGMYPRGPKAVSFGPGFQRAFSDGSIDKAELVKKIREMGIEVID